MTLKEALSVDAIRRPDDRTRTAFEMLYHPCADTLEIICKIEYGDRPFSLVGPQNFVRPAERRSHDNAGGGGGGRRPCGRGEMRGSGLAGTPGSCRNGTGPLFCRRCARRSAMGCPFRFCGRARLLCRDERLRSPTFT